ncbi:uncharacterized protein [Haliotis cracherodii]|uniref:uncharacterized protein n=1 Tax=Haliotis cracherodii TaxID=6455 RepID=UPI0039EBE377
MTGWSDCGARTCTDGPADLPVSDGARLTLLSQQDIVWCAGGVGCTTDAAMLVERTTCPPWPECQTNSHNTRLLLPPTYGSLCVFATCINPVLGPLALGANHRALRLTRHGHYTVANYYYFAAIFFSVASCVSTVCALILLTVELSIRRSQEARRHREPDEQTKRCMQYLHVLDPSRAVVSIGEDACKDISRFSAREVKKALTESAVKRKKPGMKMKTEQTSLNSTDEDN